jgi:general secretion pathway protein J
MKRRAAGFTLIELMVAVGILALMAGLSWSGLDAMVRTQTQTQERADTVLTLQAGLAQWGADLDAIVQLPQTNTLDWNGRSLRLTRRSTATAGDGILVVAWAWRRVNDNAGEWLRWQSQPVFTRSALESAWLQAARWAQNPGSADKQNEVRIAPLVQWQLYYYRGDAWSNPLSSDNTAISNAPAAEQAGAQVLPDGVRLLLTLPAGEPISGTLTRDWMRPTLGGGKS